jgi:hypothetical protein
MEDITWETYAQNEDNSKMDIKAIECEGAESNQLSQIGPSFRLLWTW